MWLQTFKATALLLASAEHVTTDYQKQFKCQALDLLPQPGLTTWMTEIIHALYYQRKFNKAVECVITHDD